MGLSFSADVRPPSDRNWRLIRVLFLSNRLCRLTKTASMKSPPFLRFLPPGRGGTNGIVYVLLSQTFLFIGICFATATIGDCSLVLLEEPTVVQSDNTTATTLGFLSYRDAETDRCYWWSGTTETTADSSTVPSDANDTIIFASTTVDSITNDTNDTSNEIIFYLTEALGQDLRVSMGLCGAALCLGLIIFLYSTSFYCSTQVKGFRVFLGALVGFVMPLLMGVGTLMVHQSEWCDVLGCSMGRSTIFSIVAAISFLLSGIFYWSMENWPGQKELDDMDKKRTWMKDPYEKKRSSPRSKSKNDRAVSSSSYRSSRRADYTGRTQHNEHTSPDESSSINDINVSFIEIPNNPPKRNPTLKDKGRSSDLKKKKKKRRDQSNRSGSNRYEDEPSPIRRSRTQQNSNGRDDSRRTATDESSEMNLMDRTDSSTFLDKSRIADHIPSRHIRSIEDIDSSSEALRGYSAHIRSIESIDDSRVDSHESSTHIPSRSFESKKKKKKRRDQSNRSGNNRYEDKPSPIRRSRTQKDDSRRTAKDESSEMNLMNRTGSSTFLDKSTIAEHIPSQHIRSIESLDDSRVEPR